MVVVFIFLAAFRVSLVTAMSIPFSVIIGFLLMHLTGITLNLLTLSAMAIAVGRLIDNSIVMSEVVYRHMKQGRDFLDASIQGAREIAGPITSSTLATVAIFVPLMFVGGIVGEMFVPFALTIIFALLASLLVALMVVPAFSKWFIGRKGEGKVDRGEAGTTWYQRLYIPSLRWAAEMGAGPPCPYAGYRRRALHRQPGAAAANRQLVSAGDVHAHAGRAG